MAHTFLLGLGEADKNIIFLAENGRDEKELQIPLMMRN